MTRELLLGTLARLMGLQDAVAAAPAVAMDPDLAPLMEGFIASRKALVEEMTQAITRGERETVRRIAHQLAGSFSLYGFEAAALRSRELESGAHEATLQDLAALAAGLRILF